MLHTWLEVGGDRRKFGEVIWTQWKDYRQSGWRNSGRPRVRWRDQDYLMIHRNRP
jgi:hypothetical protein